MFTQAFWRAIIVLLTSLYLFYNLNYSYFICNRINKYNILIMTSFFKKCMCIVGMNGLRSQSFPTIRGSVKNNEKWNNSNGVRWSDLFCKNKSTLKCTFHYLQLICCCIGFAEVETLDIFFCSVYTFLQILDASLIIIFHFLASSVLFTFFRLWQRRRGTSRRRCGNLSTLSSATSTSSLS